MLKIIELFAGIGAPRKALEFANISHKTIWFSEIDKYAENSYRAIFNDYETPNLGDITKIDVNNLQKEEVYIIIGGWPCQDISIAGKRKGMYKDSATRSSLLWETLKIIEFYKPKWIINENVSNVLSKQNFKNIQKYCEYLYNLGYETDVKILNAKDYGIPQKRKRIFRHRVSEAQQINSFLSWFVALHLHDAISFKVLTISLAFCSLSFLQIVNLVNCSVKTKHADWCSFPTIKSIWNHPKIFLSWLASLTDL